MFALICMCGGLGAVTRFVLNTSIQRWWNRAFPLSTFIINVLATFFAGVAAAPRRRPHRGPCPGERGVHRRAGHRLPPSR